MPHRLLCFRACVRFRSASFVHACEAPAYRSKRTDHCCAPLARRRHPPKRLVIGMATLLLSVVRSILGARQKPDDEDWLWSSSPTMRTGEWVLGRGVRPQHRFDGPSWGVKPIPCPQPRHFSWFDDAGLHINCSRENAWWAAWPEHRSPSGGFEWQRPPSTAPPYITEAEVVVTRCGADENWLQRVLPKGAARRRARRLGVSRPSASSRRPPDVAIVFVDSVTRHAFNSGAFPHTRRLLQELNATGDGDDGDRTRVFNFPMYHALPCCTKNWVYGALGGVFAPARNGKHEPDLAARTPWVWERAFAARGYVTHVGNDVCYPSELQDWWRSEDAPLLANLSDHPSLLDTFCRRRKDEGTANRFQTRWDGVQYEVRMDAGESICLAGRTLAGRWLDYAHSFLTHPGYTSTPRFSLTMLNDVHCRCRTGNYHVDLDLADFLTRLRPRLHQTVVMLVSDHGLLESFEQPPTDLHLPLLSLLVPRPLLRAHPPVAAALADNQRQLVTPFDIYHTLRHLPVALGSQRQQPASSDDAAGRAAVDEATWQDFRERFAANSAHTPLPYAPVPAVGPVGQSLLARLPAGRDCAAAGLPQSVCRLQRGGRRAA